MAIKKIGVIGAGTMGHGIAQVAALSGFNVCLRDSTDELTKKAFDRISKAGGKLVEKGKLSAADLEAATKRINLCQEIKCVADSDIIIEAITENPQAKLELFSTLSKIAPPHTIFATNTSSISITMLAAASGRPAQFVGMHFFNPVPVMKLVEVIRGLQTSQETFSVAFELAKQLGKVPADIKDSAGFAVNRLLLPLINEAFYLLMEGVAEAKTIDEVMQLGANHPMGPLTLGDFVGLDVALAAMEVLQKDFGDDKYRPCPLLRKYVESGWLGRKSGRGVYDYTAK
ncbi:MAG: 3-hydroxyacyl-CoA dehydrogenase NAD-binding domain-containing protein [Deltaproteobacteria bacterium]|nr:3-hydroxyacyl-CoA dehydrogenase NAD-binding domain-containing protein [Deltaproteobacteria bacterium]